MKSLIFGLACLLPTAAVAAELPLRYSYGDGPYADGNPCFIDKTGINYVDGSCVAQTRQKGPVFQLRCFGPLDEDMPGHPALGHPATVTIKEDLKAGTLTYAFKGEKPETLQRCPPRDSPEDDPCAGLQTCLE